MCKSKQDGGQRCVTHRLIEPLKSKNRQIAEKTAHLETLRAAPTDKEIRKRIIRLEGTLEGIILKRDALQTELDAVQASQTEQNPKEQAELDRQQKRRVKNEAEDANLESDLKVLLTDDEREEVENMRGERSVGDYLIHAAMNRKLGAGSKVRPLSELDMRKVTKHRMELRLDEEGNEVEKRPQGRMPTENETVRDSHIKIQNGLKNRTAATHYLNVMSSAYGLGTNAYIRMRAMGKDMYEAHAHLSDKGNKLRLSHQMRMEREAGIDANSTKEQILEARKKYDEEASARAWKAVEKKFGAHAVTALRSTYGS